MGKQRKLCGSEKNTSRGENTTSLQQRSCRKSTPPTGNANSIATSRTQVRPNALKPGDGTPRVKNHGTTQPLQPADSQPPSAYTEMRVTHYHCRADTTMNKDTLHAKLEELRTQLAAVSALDEKTHAQLRSLVTDIEHAIETVGDNEAGGESLSGQAEDLVLKSEAEHPQLTSALNQVAIALANLGI
jgi:hypothetical protein